MIRFITLTLLLMASLSNSSRADLVMLDINGFLRTSYIGPRSVFVPRFNPALGTLQSVSIVINPEISGTIEGTATGSPNSPNGWSTSFEGTLSLSGPGFTTATTSAAFPDRSGLLSQPNLPVFEFFGPEIRPISVSLTSGLSNYIGVGNANLTLSLATNQRLFFSQSGRTDRTTRDLGMQLGTVTYNFTAVPEPSSLAMGGLAAVALHVWRRRKRKCLN